MQLEKHTRKDKHTMRTEQELLKEALAVQSDIQPGDFNEEN